ncbi:DUF2963 domain-containing protein [Candidatus Phytoplasma solani]|uniref:DUF2963 domain-containing protein n=1 Tax=Candidatus Phytoplasma solani TaxID=69896 RepID=UPI00358FAAD3
MANYIKETKGRFGERVIIEYDEYAGTIVKKIYYKKSFFPLIDGTIDYIEEYDKETGQILRQIYYKKSFFPRSEATINYILEYDKDTDVAVKKIFYQSDGKTINVIYEGHKYTGFTVKETKYRTNGTIEYINEYDIDTKKLVKKKLVIYLTEKLFML